jgi:hypothetical protein
MKKIVFILALALGFAWNCHAQTWTYVQDSLATFCSAGNANCTVGTGNILPTTAGTVWIMLLTTNGNNSIKSVTGGGGTWVHCPNCLIWDSTLNRNLDMYYNLGGNTGSTNFVVSLNSAAVGQFGINFIELLPPAGSTPSYDASGTSFTNSCSTCTGVGLSITGTAAILQGVAWGSPSSWNGWSSPYLTLPLGEGLNLNATSGTAPTMVGGGPGAVFSAIAFTSSLGSYTPPTLSMSVLHHTDFNMSCSPSCTLNIPATTAGSLLYIEAANITGLSSFITAVSGGGTWTAPTACRISMVLAGNDALSCAYNLSATGGTTQLTVTGNSSNDFFAVWEIASTSGPFSLDAIGSATNSASLNPSGVSLSLTGANDVIFQSAFVPGGTSSVSYYTYPRIPGQGTMFFNNQAANSALLNTTNGNAPKWIDQQNQGTIVSGIAFRTGTATALAPPTALTAVVN